MRTESEAFTVEDVWAFLRAVSARERQHLAGRLETASERLDQLAAGFGDAGDNGRSGDGWSAVQLLAHIAMVARFYGWLAHQVGTGRATEIEYMPQVWQRDRIVADLAELPVGELLSMARSNLARSAAYVRQAPLEDMRRTARLAEGLVMSAEEVARLSLCAHVEDHLDQLERALGEARAPARD